MLEINTTSIIGQILLAGTTTTTGSYVLTIYLLFMFFFAISILFGISTDITLIFLLPFIIVVTAFNSDFYSLLIVSILILAFVITKNWLFR